METQTSKRRQEILKAAAEFGLPMNSPKDIAALVSRDAKDYAGLSQVEGLWKASFDTYAEKSVFNGKDLLSESIMRQQNKLNKTQETTAEKGESQSTTPRHEAVAIKEEASNTIDRTIANLSSYQTTLSYHAVLERALTSFNHEEGINFADLKNALDDRLSKGELVALDGDATKFTTKALIESEKKLIDQSKIQVRGIAHKVKDKFINQCELNKENSYY